VGYGSDDHLLELEYTTESARGRPLRTVPALAFAVSAHNQLAVEHFAEGQEPLMVGEQLTLHGDLPTSGSVLVRTRVMHRVEKAAGTLLFLRTLAVYADTGAPAVTREWQVLQVRSSSHGRRGRRSPGPPEPDGAARHVEVCVPRNQALLYRVLTGRNAVHSDPAVAADYGFPEPILAGRHSLALAARAIAHELRGGDQQAVVSFGARMAGPAFPGRGLLVRMRTHDDVDVAFDMVTEDGRVVLTHGTATLRS
jgi:acyl dehydratase